MTKGLWREAFVWNTFILVICLLPINSQRIRGSNMSGPRYVLHGAGVPFKGNVMVTANGGLDYRPLCDDFFGMAEANAVCATLGFQRALRFTRFHSFGTRQRWNPDGWKFMYNLQCPKSNNRIDTRSCSLTNNKEDMCTSGEVAGVECQTHASDPRCPLNYFICSGGIRSSSLSSSCIPEDRVCNGSPDCYDGSDEKAEICGNREGPVVRLESEIQVNLPDNTVAGTVYFKINGLWMGRCDDNVNQETARVICELLGYGDGMSVPFMGGYFGTNKGDSYVCRGPETSRSQCPVIWSNANGCSYNLDPGMFCHAGKLRVQLVGGRTPASGRLEIFSSSLSSPASICGTGFDDLDAQVVCRMRGYDGNQAVAHKGSPFGMGSGDIWNIILDCLGHEKSIQDCRIKISNNTCTHRNTAAVTCVGERSVEELLRLVLPADCGEPLDSSNQFITSFGKVRGGRIPSRFDVPWLAALRVKRDAFYEHNCGAVIISEYYLLTAAHCFMTIGKLQTIVTVGDFNRNYNERFQQNYFIDKLWIHEDFGETAFVDNDIALLKIQGVNGRGMKLDARVKAVCLPQVGEIYENLKSCMVAGWGVMDNDNSSMPTILPRAAEIDSVPEIICEKIYTSRNVTSSKACFGRENLFNGCKGDSGGPVTCRGAHGRHVLYGIHSFGNPCRPDYVLAKVSVRVTKYLRWIWETIAGDLRLN